MGTEKSDERKRGMQKKNEKEPAAGDEKIELHVYYVIGRASGRREKDISWPSSPIGTVSCTAFVLSHRTGGPPDISWPSSPIGTVSCTASVLSHRTCGPQDIS